MTYWVGMERTAYVHAMFARVAKHYDRLNRLVSMGQDMKWRRRVIDLAQIPSGGRVLDIGAGTGDLSQEALRRDNSALAVGGDFTMEMMRQGRTRPGGERIRWLNANALDLPFPPESFDAVVSGYLLRNVVDVHRALAEQYRVLKPGGTVVCLDTTPPPPDWRHGLVRFHLRVMVPLMGRLIANEAEAYTYLPESTLQFLEPEELAACMQRAGFQAVQFLRLMFGTMAIHWGRKTI
jgi:demethylmenaquinone methyltransferase/2-methoxy-6-polyprenyl-1,4-benzoquinol methylase